MHEVGVAERGPRLLQLTENGHARRRHAQAGRPNLHPELVVRDGGARHGYRFSWPKSEGRYRAAVVGPSIAVWLQFVPELGSCCNARAEPQPPASLATQPENVSRMKATSSPVRGCSAPARLVCTCCKLRKP